MNINILLGKTLTSCEGCVGDEVIRFETKDKKIYKLYHEQSCYEEVRVEDICGDLKDLAYSYIVNPDLNTYFSKQKIAKTRGELPKTKRVLAFGVIRAAGNVMRRWRNLFASRIGDGYGHASFSRHAANHFLAAFRHDDTQLSRGNPKCAPKAMTETRNYPD